MSLAAYMKSPIGFGAYGEEYRPEIELNLVEEDFQKELSPLSTEESMPWALTKQLGGFGDFVKETKGIVLGVGAGVLVGLAAGQFKDGIEHKFVRELVSPASASITTLAIYWLVS